MKKSQPIYLIGLPRCGSTWVSKAIATATQRRIVHEPFNWLRFPDRINYHMKYLRSDAHDETFTKILSRSSKPTFPFLDFLCGNQGVILKDVHICLAIDYLGQTINPHMILLLRHPCAMAQSWKRLNLQVDFRIKNLLEQDQLMSDYLAPFKTHLSKKQDNFFFSFGAYWGASYYVMMQISKNYPNWVWAIHENLCVNSNESFLAILKRLDMRISKLGEKNLRNFIKKYNRMQKKNEGDHSYARLTTLEPKKWLDILTPQEIRTTLEGVEPFGLLDDFYIM